MRGWVKQLGSLPESLSLSSLCIAAHGLGGDCCDYWIGTSGAFYLVVADVMGKDISAGLCAQRVKELCGQFKRTNPGPGELMRELNWTLLDELSRAEMFITAQIVEINLNSRRLSVANAGHCPCMLAGTANEVTCLESDGLPLGIIADAVFPEFEADLPKDFRLLLYTDGVTEAPDAGGARLGQSRLESWFRRASEGGADASSIQQQLLANLSAYQGHLRPFDDQTLLIAAEARDQWILSTLGDAAPRTATALGLHR